MTQQSESDELFLKGFCAGDEACAEKFVQRFRPRLSCIGIGW